ncbi:MAG: DUF7281 domain-containing protein, partial [Shewanella sp.]
MARLGRRQLEQLQRVYIKRAAKVKLTPDWLTIYRELEVGELDGAAKNLCFLPQDFELLRQGVLALMGLDLRALDFDVDRMAMAAKSHHEKLAKIPPEADYLLLKFVGFTTPPLPLSALTALRAPIRQAHDYCREFKVESILVVENLDVFDVIHQAGLPSNLGQVLVLYRGSGHHSPIGVRHFLQQIAGQMPIIAFTDIDPAGLQIAHTLTGVTHWLVPQLALSAPNELMAKAQINASGDFDRQAKQLKYLQQAQLHNWQSMVTWLGRWRISMKQQHLLAHGLDWVLLAYRL